LVTTEKMLGLFQPLTSQGFTVFAVRHGSSPKFSIEEAVADVRRSVRFIRLNAERFNIDPQRIGVYGMSAGGHLSLMLGTTSDDGNPQADDPVERVSNRVQL
jgi:acetyl esterase/lipase